MKIRRTFAIVEERREEAGRAADSLLRRVAAIVAINGVNVACR